MSRHAPHLLSGGQKQRIAIAGVIAMEPECIVLDEATAMLDPVGRQEVLSTVHRLNREKGITVVLITHHMNEAEEADRVVVMDDGKVAMDGTPREVFTQVEQLRDHGTDGAGHGGSAGPAAPGRAVDVPAGRPDVWRSAPTPSRRRLTITGREGRDHWNRFCKFNI